VPENPSAPALARAPAVAMSGTSGDNRFVISGDLCFLRLIEFLGAVAPCRRATTMRWRPLRAGPRNRGAAVTLFRDGTWSIGTSSRSPHHDERGSTYGGASSGLSRMAVSKRAESRPANSSVQPVKSRGHVPAGRHQPTTGGPIAEISISKRSGSAEGMKAAWFASAIFASWAPPQLFGYDRHPFIEAGLQLLS
jgi:hypothetical protein